MSFSIRTALKSPPTNAILSREKIGVVAAGLAIAGGAVFAALGLSETARQTAAEVNAVSGSVQERFIELNTSALDALAPQAATSVTTSASDGAVGGFLYWNTTALDGIAQRSSADVAIGADRGFLYWNTTALELPQPGYAQPASGPR